MGVDISGEDTMAAAIILAAQMNVNPQFYSLESSQKLAELCIELGANIRAARLAKLHDQ
jgi:hypothetical protein